VSLLAHFREGQIVIYEIRTYTTRTGKVGEYEALFAGCYPTREKYSKLFGYWHTEIGPLNQLIHIWPYDNLQQRADIRAQSAKDPSGKWPPPPNDLLLMQENDILVPIKNMPERSGPQQWGNLYELRMYTYPAGSLPKVAEKFSEMVEARNKVYPVAGIWTSDLGNLNRLYQLFPYKDWAHRDQVRAELREKHLWPPETDVRPMTQLVRHLIPAAFSPLH
jgi:NIPSNAP